MIHSRKIYLDHNATTPVDSRVVNEMLPYFSEVFGNASSIGHVYGWDAEEAVDRSRETIANLIGARANEVYFTSGATESINIGLQGVCLANKKRGNHIITCTTEHKAVLDTCQQLESQGLFVTYLDVDPCGNIDLDELENMITEKTILVCLMHGNNEIGILHPLKEISKITKTKDVLLMTDATQTIGKVSFNVGEQGVDIAAFSAHKLYGPKGIGALYINKQSRSKVDPIQFGGGQEKGLRPGTLNVPGIVGFGKACEICEQEMENESIRLEMLRNLFEKEIATVEGVKINGNCALRLPHVSSISFENIDGSRLLRSLKHLAVSQGSACTSGSVEPSYVLKSLGYSDELALASLRIGLGRQTSGEEVKIAINEIKNAVEKLRLTIS